MGAGTFFGNNATVVGYKTFQNTTGNITGWVAIGNFIGASMATTAGNFSVAIGHYAAQKHQGADPLMAIGYEAFQNVNSAKPGTAIGYNAGKNVTTGIQNTFLGYRAGVAVTTGNGNTLLAHDAAPALTSGSNNTVVGYGAGDALLSGSGNTLVGYQAGNQVQLGANNTIVGACIGTTGAGFSGNVILANGTGDIRFQANYYGAWSPGGTDYGAVGYVLTSQGTDAPPVWAPAGGGGSPATPTVSGTVFGHTAQADDNTFLGWGSGEATTGGKNTFIGHQTGQGVTTGTTNTIIGHYLGTAGLTGHVILADGDGSIRFSSNMGAAVSFDGTTYGNNGQFLMSRGDAQRPIWQDAPTAASATPTAAGVVYALTNQGSGAGNNNAFLGYQAGLNATASSAVAVGQNAMQNSAASLSVALGNGALQNATAGAQGCVAIGFNVMSAGMNAPNNIAIGNGAMAAGTSVLGIAIGYQAAAAMTTAQAFVAIGGGSLKTATTNALAVGATAVGYDTFPVATQPAYTTGLGFRAGWKVTTGQNNTFLGNYAGSEVTTGSNNTIVGRWNGTAGMSNVVALSDGATIPNLRLYFNSTGAMSVDGTNFGAAGQVLTSQGDAANPIWTSPPATTPATPTTLGVVVGSTPLDNFKPIQLGYNAGKLFPANINSQSVVIGQRALQAWTATTGPGVYIGGDAGMMQTAGEGNVFIGTVTGTGSTTYNYNTVVGYNSMSANGAGLSPEKNTVLGSLAGQSLKGNSNVLIGYNVCRMNATNYSNAVIIGTNFTADTLTVDKLDGHVIITKGDGTVRLDINAAGAVSFDSTNYGVIGQVLTSQGSSGRPVWANSPPPTQYTFGTLPTTGVVLGQQGTITDGPAGLNWGDAPAGGGTTRYLVWYNGTRWSILGK